MSRDVADMRALMGRERPPRSRWDLKLTSGGLVDIEFAAQALQVAHAAAGGPLLTSTEGALRAMAEARLADPTAVATLVEAFRLQSSLNQLLKLALVDYVAPEREPDGFRMLLARAAGCASFEALERRLATVHADAHSAYEAVLTRLR